MAPWLLASLCTKVALGSAILAEAAHGLRSRPRAANSVAWAAGLMLLSATGFCLLSK